MLKREPKLHDIFFEGDVEGEIVTVTRHKEEVQIGVRFITDIIPLTLFYNRRFIEPYQGGWHKNRSK
jgi:hypothetical protein